MFSSPWTPPHTVGVYVSSGQKGSSPRSPLASYGGRAKCTVRSQRTGWGSLQGFLPCAGARMVRAARRRFSVLSRLLEHLLRGSLGPLPTPASREPYGASGPTDTLQQRLLPETRVVEKEPGSGDH